MTTKRAGLIAWQSGLVAVVFATGCTVEFTNPLFQDGDGDGLTIAMGDCDDSDPDGTSVLDDADCDGVLTSDDCDDGDPSLPADDADCDGVLTSIDCDDGSPSAPADDADCDGIFTSDDCNDVDPTSTTLTTDADCDGVLTSDDCDDADPTSTTLADDADCDGVFAAADCDDGDPSLLLVAEDSDCDGVLTSDDCDDGDPASTTIATDADCDSVLTADDCDDRDPLSTVMAEDEDCDGVLAVDDCDDRDPGPTLGRRAACPGLSCLDIMDRETRSADGEYWIDPMGRGAYQVVCDMTTSGGGWTMVMKAVDDNFSYTDPLWENDSVYNATDLDPERVGKAKYQSFMDVEFFELRSSDPSSWYIDESYSFSTRQSSARALFLSFGFTISTTTSPHFDSRYADPEAWEVCTSLERYGINLLDVLGCESTSAGCDYYLGGARFGNRVTESITVAIQRGRGWGAYSCKAGIIFDWGGIRELMWVR